MKFLLSRDEMDCWPSRTSLDKIFHEIHVFLQLFKRFSSKFMLNPPGILVKHLSPPSPAWRFFIVPGFNKRWHITKGTCVAINLFKHTFCCRSWGRRGIHQSVSPPIAYFMLAGRISFFHCSPIAFPYQLPTIAHSLSRLTNIQVRLVLVNIWMLFMFPLRNWWCTGVWSIKGL